jgi:archaeosine-15-forming tRNA-guanine transglycosylase
MQHDDVGGTWHVNLDVGREIAATDRVARIWVEDDSVLSMNSTPGMLTLSSSTAAALGLAHACGENSKPDRNLRPKVNRGLTTGAC